jgi:hypothetical protein
VEDILWWVIFLLAPDDVRELRRLGLTDEPLSPDHVRELRRLGLTDRGREIIGRLHQSARLWRMAGLIWDPTFDRLVAKLGKIRDLLN